MTVQNVDSRGLAVVIALRDEARLVANRLSDVWEQARTRDHWTSEDALVAYRVAEARWQGLNEAVRAIELLPNR